ncbi:unnamed protein product [Dibothriocephalus latus]|uniref:Uncharacterized protein n=1 Tax=Dibothriocephalus latus TaxID=60516 RepID=A0A3P7KYS9_DIBLA|nr:unnamed protein product [Dibothriocephalus latus]
MCPESCEILSKNAFVRHEAKAKVAPLIHGDWMRSLQYTEVTARLPIRPFVPERLARRFNGRWLQGHLISHTLMLSQ